jgi:long-chain acyl-CoA synthetase
MKVWIRWKLANRLVLSPIRNALGLGKARTLAAGAAALPSHVFHWFRSIGLEILEDYGQTESTGVICMAEKGVDCSGSVGKAVAGLEVALAEDGEILTRGRHVFKGYLKDEASTEQVLRNGWLHTGDLARQDDRGYFRIQGRKKEVLKTSGGKMVAPLPIEEALRASPVISQVCLVGDGRKYLSALITLSENRMSQFKQRFDSSRQPVITAPEITQEVQKYIDQLNASLASYEQIKKFAVLAREFSVQEGEMTPTLKIKRNVIESHYKDVIEQFYASA